MVNKVVYNKCYGGFSLSQEACNRLRELGVDPGFQGRDLPRHLPELVQVVEELKELANGDYADLGVRTLHGDAYRIDEYDGSEGVVEPDQQTWIRISH